ncbi:MAG: MerR family transcriptional regulator [Oscillospiraceae bacterium]|nr:MerR family transcriptional regulator [Oscillospiraceae bacterium]
MTRKDIFSIHDFAKYARTTRDTLLHYDKIKLLTPVTRGENNYRYYSHGQLAVMNLIRTFKTLGMPLVEIKRLKDIRTPELSKQLLGNQLTRINEEIDKLLHAKKLLELIKDIIETHLDIDEEIITLQQLPERSIVLGKQNDYSGTRSDYDALYDFYEDCHEKYPDLDLNYPVWAIFSQERLRRREWIWPDKYYFYGPEGYEKIPPGLHVVGYKRGGYGNTHSLYERLLEFIDENGYDITGPAYEEYPLNEICVLNDEDYLIAISIPVKIA